MRLVVLMLVLVLLGSACGGETPTVEDAVGQSPDASSTEAVDGEGSPVADSISVPDNPGEGVRSDEIVLGWMGDATGPTASSQSFNLAGSQAAVRYYNDQGGILGRELMLLDRDDQFSAETAAGNYQALVNDENVLALLQMGGGHISEALMPDVERDQIPLIGPPQTIDAQLANPYVFNNMAHYSDQADVAVEFAAQEVGDVDDVRAVVAHIELPSGEEYAEYFSARLEAEGGTAIDTLVLNVSSPDFPGAALALQGMVADEDVNYISLAGAPTHAIGMMNEMRSLDVPVPLIGIHGIASPTVYLEGPQDMHDLVVGIHSFLPPVADCELCAVIRDFQGDDADALNQGNFAHGWLDIYIAVQAIERAAESGELSRDSLFEALQGEFDTGGLTCPIDWTQSNHSACAMPFRWDGENLSPVGTFEQWATVLQGEYAGRN